MRSYLILTIMAIALMISACAPQGVPYSGETDDNMPEDTDDSNTNDEADDTQDNSELEPLIGGERDEHGCLVGAGYTYNEDIGACLRAWELEDQMFPILAAKVAADYMGHPKGLTIERANIQRTRDTIFVDFDVYGEKTSVKINNLQPPQMNNDPDAIHSFEECVAAGNAVMESYPRQCRTEDGLHFVSESDQLQIKAQEYCGQDDIASVSICGDYIHALSSLAGGETTVVSRYGNEIYCPVMDPNEMTDFCFNALMADVACESVCENSDESNTQPEQQFCGSSTNFACDTNADCAPRGCSGEICAGVNEEELGASICIWKGCFDEEQYGLACQCVNNQCQWA